jgi:hypothetical protein
MADTKNKRSFFISATVINRYKKLGAGVTINCFSSSELCTRLAVLQRSHTKLLKGSTLLRGQCQALSTTFKKPRNLGENDRKWNRFRA